jgi:hypothetical protein
VQSIEFFAFRQLFRQHDFADLIFNGHGSILSEFPSNPHQRRPSTLKELSSKKHWSTACVNGTQLWRSSPTLPGVSTTPLLDRVLISLKPTKRF